MQSPVLFLVFNRPETTAQVFEAIRSARPPKLYVSADGPRSSKEGEVDICSEVQEIATSVDWPCEVKTLFSEVNLGCKLGVSRGITWFFENEEEGIILEDDILPLPSFFKYCDELLEYYRDNDRVAMISGCNLVSNYDNIPDSYAFSAMSHIWGWASWRRSWNKYDVEMSSWTNWEKSKKLSLLSCGNSQFVSYWSEIFQMTFRGDIDTWDYQWLFSCWKADQLSIIPQYNLIENLGFSSDATHTTGDIPTYLSKSSPREIIFPLQHPEIIAQNVKLDKKIFNKVLLLNRKTKLIKWVKKIKRICS